MTSNSEIILYESDGVLQLEVRIQDETVWLTQAQMSDLFVTDRTSITKHIRNIYNSKIQLVQKLHKFKQKDTEALHD